MKKKKKKKIAFFIGRFQPFHMGHLFALEKILKKYKKVVIGVGSAQEKNTLNNPFSANKRIFFIKKILKKKWKKNVKIVKIDDASSDIQWIKNIKKRFSTKKYEICSQNQLVIKLAKQEGYGVYRPKFLKREIFQAKKIRKKLLLGKNIKNFVPRKIKKEIEQSWKKIVKNIIKNQ
ncbi:MAG: nicotinamide-nucleotide adenylyltransferase [Candidatus Anstonellaceae archaeon]